MHRRHHPRTHHEPLRSFYGLGALLAATVLTGSAAVATSGSAESATPGPAGADRGREATALRWTFGKKGDLLPFYKSLPVRPGWYAVDGHVAVHSTDGDEHVAGCYAFPQKQANAGNYSNVIAAHTAPSLSSYVSVSGVIHVPKHDSIEFACQVDGTGQMDQASPATFVARRVHVVDGPPAHDIGPMRTSLPTGAAVATP